MTRQGAQAAGAEAWAHLFNPAQVTCACDALHEAIVGAAAGWQGLMHETLHAQLVVPLDLYLGATDRAGGARQAHVEAALALRALACDLADKFAERWPFEADDAPSRVAALRAAWDRMRAEGASHYVYAVAAANAQRARGPRRGRKASAKARPLTAEIVAQRMREQGLRELPKALLLDLCAEFGVHESTVYRRLDAARAQNLLA